MLCLCSHNAVDNIELLIHSVHRYLKLHDANSIIGNEKNTEKKRATRKLITTQEFYTVGPIVLTFMELQ